MSRWELRSVIKGRDLILYNCFSLIYWHVLSAMQTQVHDTLFCCLVCVEQVCHPPLSMVQRQWRYAPGKLMHSLFFQFDCYCAVSSVTYKWSGVNSSRRGQQVTRKGDSNSLYLNFQYLNSKAALKFLLCMWSSAVSLGIGYIRREENFE